MLSTLPRCLSFYGQYFSLPVFIFPSHSHSLRCHIVNALVNAPLSPTLSADNANLGQHRRLRRKKEVERCRSSNSPIERCRCRVSGRSPVPENVHGNLVTKDDFTRGVSILRYGVYTFRNAHAVQHIQPRYLCEFEQNNRMIL